MWARLLLGAALAGGAGAWTGQAPNIVCSDIPLSARYVGNASSLAASFTSTSILDTAYANTIGVYSGPPVADAANGGIYLSNMAPGAGPGLLGYQGLGSNWYNPVPIFSMMRFKILPSAALTWAPSLALYGSNPAFSSMMVSTNKSAAANSWVCFGTSTDQTTILSGPFADCAAAFAAAGGTAYNPVPIVVTTGQWFSVVFGQVLVDPKRYTYASYIYVNGTSYSFGTGPLCSGGSCPGPPGSRFLYGFYPTASSPANFLLGDIQVRSFFWGGGREG